MKHVTMVVRYLFALMLIVFGANKFLSFMPMPELSGDAGTVMSAFVGSGYIFPIIGVLMILTGLSLVFKKYTALMLVIMAPIALNMFLFHAVLDPAGILMSAVIVVFNIVMLYAYRNAYKDLFKPCSGGACKV